MPDTCLTKNATSDITAGLYRRLFALIYDAFLIIAILFCVTMLYTFIVVILSSEVHSNISAFQNNDVLNELEPIPLGWPYYCIVITLYISFYFYFWKKTGQTLGMQAWKIKLINEKSGAISIKQCALRMLAAIFSFAFFGFGFLTLLFNRDAGCWHDKASSTRVICYKIKK